MFDSPMEHCPVCGHYVILDQPQAECARRQQCAGDAVCPLRTVFSAVDLSMVQALRRPTYAQAI